MSKAKLGDRVRIHYEGRMKDGTVIGFTEEGDPLEFEAGSDGVIPGVSKAVVGMAAGETRELTLSPDKAFGVIEEDLVIEVPLADLPAGLTPKVGMRLGGKTEGKSWAVLVKEVKEETVLLDANHPLAGETLDFNIELVEIVAE